VEESTCSYAIISDYLVHDKQAAATFIEAIVEALAKKSPTPLTSLDIWSDGTAQHLKQHYMFMFLIALATQFHMGVSWEFIVTSHGKGAVDGIGGTIKRKVFAIVKSREFVINNPVKYYEVAKVKSPVINVLYVSTERIDIGCTNLDDIWSCTNPVPGTHTLIMLELSDVVRWRQL
jgi:hypothetical protein